ncbi:hypothetical protein C8R45DRAFT_900107 [Mycena sanguinolenta]|nr:hypothetical protein C8R45DRAFT_900107 [Mycena sanguinolenta]
MSFGAGPPNWHQPWPSAAQSTPQRIPYGPRSPFIPPAAFAPRPLLPSPNYPYTPYAQESPPLGFGPLPHDDGFPFLPLAGVTPPMQMVPFSPGPFSPVPMGPFSPMPMVPFSPMQMSPAQPSTDWHPVVFAKKDPCDCECLAARPSDWRHDYTPPRRFHFPSLFQGASGDRTKINLEHSHLSPMLLMPNSRMPVMSFDLRSDDPFDPSNLELLAIGDRPFNPTDLLQFATIYPVSVLRFYHPRLPWYLDVRASQPNGILVADVLQQFHAMLHWPIQKPDFSNTVLNATDREGITGAYRNRCDVRVDIMQQGMRRVDFLGPDVILQGFVRGKNGMWLMKTTSYSRNM